MFFYKLNALIFCPLPGGLQDVLLCAAIVRPLFPKKHKRAMADLPSPPVRVDYCVLEQFPLKAAFTDTL